MNDTRAGEKRGIRSGPAACAAAALLSVALISCSAIDSSPLADEPKILAYVKASRLYDQGLFADASAAVEAGSKGFQPAAILRGKSLWFAGESGAAEAALREAVLLRPASIEARLWLARVLRGAGKKDESRKLAEGILSDAPDDCRALRLSSELACDSGDAALARSYLDRAAESGSELGLALLDRARLRWAAGEGQATLEDIAAAAAVLPKEGSAYRAARALEKAVREAGQ